MDRKIANIASFVCHRNGLLKIVLELVSYVYKYNLNKFELLVFA